MSCCLECFGGSDVWDCAGCQATAVRSSYRWDSVPASVSCDQAGRRYGEKDWLGCIPLGDVYSFVEIQSVTLTAGCCQPSGDSGQRTTGLVMCDQRANYVVHGT